MAYHRKKLSRAQAWLAVLCLGILIAAGIIIAINDPDSLFSFVNINNSAVNKSEPNLKIDIINVGNADSILVTNEGKSLLIDAGENIDGNKVVAYLRSHNIQKLDYVIATHPHADHIGGMDNVINSMPIDTFIMSTIPSKITPTTKTYLDMLEALKHKNITPKKAKFGVTYALGEASIDILGPLGEFETLNNMSVICRITYGNRHFLFMGDAEKEAEDALLASGTDLAADFIKVGHHGSHSSSQDKFIKAVSPKYAAITCGKNNDYGHPNKETLTTLKKYGVKYYRCDINGTITVTCDGDLLSVKTKK